MTKRSYPIEGGPQVVLDNANRCAQQLRAGEDFGMWEIFAHNGPNDVSVWNSHRSHDHTKPPKNCSEFVQKMTPDRIALEVTGTDEQEDRAHLAVIAALRG